MEGMRLRKNVCLSAFYLQTSAIYHSLIAIIVGIKRNSVRMNSDQPLDICLQRVSLVKNSNTRDTRVHPSISTKPAR